MDFNSIFPNKLLFKICFASLEAEGNEDSRIICGRLLGAISPSFFQALHVIPICPLLSVPLLF